MVIFQILAKQTFFVYKFEFIRFSVRKFDESVLSNKCEKCVFVSRTRCIFTQSLNTVSHLLHIWPVPWALTSVHGTKQGHKREARDTHASPEKKWPKNSCKSFSPVLQYLDWKKMRKLTQKITVIFKGLLSKTNLLWLYF